MGRGLSELQRTALAIAYRNRQAGGVSDRNTVDAYYAEIMAEHYGFTPHPRVDLHSPGRQHFSRSKIGPERYDAAKAALSRAMKRLEERGLVVVAQGANSHWSGIELTDAGVQAATQQERD